MSSHIFRSSWFLASLFFTLVTIGIGCSSADTGEKPKKGEGEANAQNAAPAPAQPAAPAADAAAPKEEAKGRRANRKNAKIEEAVAKAKEKQEKGGDAAAATPAVPTKLSSENPAEWKIDDLKVALNKKDARYAGAVAMHGAQSQGDAAAGTGLSELLVAVTKLPADGSAAPNGATKAVARRKKNSRRGDDEPSDAAAMPPAAAVPPTAATAPAAGPAPTSIVPPGTKLNIGRRKSE